MFKIESYVTPLILSYVSKYVKNIRPEDSQLSLWGGDAVFSNLDLRLEALERELRLPFRLVNGHIHELRIHVPWTKLTSEPVVITINTIECVLRLGEPSGSSSASSSSKASSTPSTTTRFRRVSSPRGSSPDGGGAPSSQGLGPQPPGGYLGSLLQRVLHNVTVVLNNVILKYAEEDLVLSLNIKAVELASADASWQPAFAHLAQEDPVLRKLVSMEDVTVCLDKRDASGKIEAYQEPLLYRCFMSGRLHTRYEGAHPVALRFHLSCERLDLSLTDQQLPLFVRLLDLCLALYYGRLACGTAHVEDDEGGASRDATTTASSSSPDQAQSTSTVTSWVSSPGEGGGGDEQGWGAWAWSMVPQILPTWEEEMPGVDDDGVGGDPTMVDTGWPTLYHVGCYVAKATCVFKTTGEDSSTGRLSRRQSMTGRPLLQLELHGTTAEMSLQGLTWVHLQVGVTGAALSGSERCACGFDEAVRRAGRSKGTATYVRAGVTTGGHTYNHLTGSLFDPLAPENSGQSREPEPGLDAHVERLTELAMAERFPALCMDYLYELQVPNEWDDSNEAEEPCTVAFLESSNWVERSLCRSVIGPLVADITSGTVHRIQWLLECVTGGAPRPTYGQDEIAPLPFPVAPPSEEQLERLSQFVPSRTYRLAILKPRIRLCPATHSAGDTARQKSVLRRKYSREDPGGATTASSGLPSSSLPLLELQLECLDLSLSRPMYARKMTALLATDEGASLPDSLRQQCFCHMQAKLWGLTVDLAAASNKASARPPARAVLLDPAWATVTAHTVAYPALLAHGPHSLARSWSTVEVGPLRLSASKQRAMAAIGVALSWHSGPAVTTTLGASSLLGNLVHEGSSTMELVVGGLSWSFSEDVQACTHSASIVSISLVLTDKERSMCLVHAPESTGQVPQFARQEADMERELSRAEESWIRATARVPLNWSSNTGDGNGYVVLKVKGVAVVLDPALVTWLAPLPLIFPMGGDFHAAGPVTAPFSPTASEDGALSLSDEISRELPQEARGSASGSQRSTTTSLVSPPDLVGPRRLLRTNSEASVSSKAAADHLPKSFNSWLYDTYLHLKNFSVQADVANVCVLFPRSPMLLAFPRIHRQPGSVEPVPSVLLQWRRLLKGGSEGSLVCALLPAVNITSADSRPKQATTGTATEAHDSTSGERFPWCVKLSSWAAFEAHAQHVRHMLKPASLSCTVALTPSHDSSSQHSRPPQLGLCIHVDVEPFHLSLSKKQLNEIRQVLLLLAAVHSNASNTMAWFHQPGATIPEPIGLKPPILRPTPKGLSRSLSRSESAEKNVTTPAVAVSPTTKAAPLDSPSLTLWLQWTLPKVGINLFGKSGEGSLAKHVWLQLEAEDVTASLDVQEVYSKVKLKMASFNISCFQKSAAEPTSSWEVGPYEGVVFSCTEKLNRQTGRLTAASASLGQHKQADFLNLTWTRALCAHVRRNIHKSRKDFVPLTEAERQAPRPHFLSEVDLKLAPLDVVLHTCVAGVVADMAVPVQSLLELLLWNPAASVVSVPSKKSQPAKPAGWELNSRALPLVYLSSGTIRIFLPVDDVGSERRPPLGSGDVCLVQVGAASLSPQVENPLCRRPLREDLYSWAQEQGMLNAVGSDLEDRQYQLRLTAFFLCTLSWSDLVGHQNGGSREEAGAQGSNGSQPVTTLMGENPAFEWNRQPPGSHVLGRASKAPVPLHFVTSCCDLHVALAPAMVFVEGTADGTQEVLVCGHSVEASIPRDLHCHLSLDQVALVHRIFSQYLGIVGRLAAATTPAGRHAFPALRHTPDFRDSGLGSELSEAVDSSVQAPGGSGTALSFVPFDLLLTASTVSLTLGQVEADGRKRARSPPSCSDDEDVGYDASEDSDSRTGDEGAATSHPAVRGGGKVVPLARLVVLQPHTFLSCSSTEQRAELSCFDVQVGGVPTGFRAAGRCLSELASPGTFVEPWLETRPGEPHPKTGIPPSLFTLSLHGFLLPQVTLCVKVGRPLRVNLSAAKVDQALQFAELASNQWDQIQGSAPPLHPLREQAPPEATTTSQMDLTESATAGPSSDEWRLSTKLDMEQLVLSLDFPVQHHQGFKMVLALESHASELEVLCSSSGVPSSIESRTTLSCLQLSAVTGQQQQCTALVGPSTFVLWTDSFWEQLSGPPTVHSVLRVHCDVLPVHCGPSQLQCCTAAARHVAQLLASVAERLEKIAPRDKGKEQKAATPTVTKAPQGKSWCDDLRNGSFQYIQDDGTPNPNEIVFRRPLKNGDAGVMTWRYPEPRVLTRVDVYPVPFSSTGTMGAFTPPALQCQLQYWEPCQEVFVSCQQFELSESEPCFLELPALAFQGDQPPPVAVADTWRVIILPPGQPPARGSTEEPTAGTAMSPLALAACMRVDSHFDPALVPRLRASVAIDTCVVTLTVPAGQTVPPEAIWPFELDHSACSFASLDFATVSLDHLCLSYTGWQHRTNLGVNGYASCHMTELRHLTRLSVLDSVGFKASAIVCQPLNKEPSIEVETSLDPCFIRISQPIVHTLSTAATLWSQDPHTGVLPCYVAVCNNTTDTICFGQAGTVEKISLQPGHMHAYTWKSTKAPLMLRLGIESQQWKWSSPFKLVRGKEVTVEVPVGSSGLSTVLVRMQEGRGVEMQVIISGQVTLRGHLVSGLQVQLRLLLADTTREQQQQGKASPPLVQAPKTRTVVVDLGGDRACCRSLILSPRRLHSFSLRRLGPSSSTDGQGGRVTATLPWSAEVVLNSAGQKDWARVIEVPQDTEEIGKLQLWCYCFAGCFGSSANLMVLAFTPLHVLRSHLPSSLLVHLHGRAGFESASEHYHSLSVPGRGRDWPLLVDPLPSSLTFQLGPGKRVSSPPLELRPPALDHEVSTTPPEDLWRLRSPEWSYGSPHAAKWPYDDPDRSDQVDRLWEQGRLATSAHQLSSSPSSPVPSPSPSSSVECPTEVPETELHVKQYHDPDLPFPGTVLVDIKPWAFLVNSTGTELRLLTGNHGVWTLSRGQAFAPPPLHEPFFVAIEEGGTLHCCLRPLRVDPSYLLQKKDKGDSSATASEESANLLQLSVPTPVCICFRYPGSPSYAVCRLTALAQDFEGCLVVTFRSAVYLSNQTDLPLAAAGFTVRALLGSSTQAWTGAIEMAAETSLPPGGHESQGVVPLLFWNSSSNIDDTEIDEVAVGRLFVSLALNCQPAQGGGRLWSFPVALEQQQQAKNVRCSMSLFKPSTGGASSSSYVTVPLAVTCHWRAGSVYVVVARDANPLLRISNATCATLVFAENGLAEDLWLLPSVGPGSSVHFTPPSLLAYCNGLGGATDAGGVLLLLGCLRDAGPQLVSWSSPVACLDVANQFVRIPGLGDVRVSAQRAGHTTHLLVQLVSRAEVSAKEIRSRIGEPQPANNVCVTPGGTLTDGLLSMAEQDDMPAVPPEDLVPLSPLHRSLQFASLNIAELCLVLCDECDDVDEGRKCLREVVRLSLDSVSCACRPRAAATSSPALAGNLQLDVAPAAVYDVFAFIGGIQVDNQLAQEEQSSDVYDFPVVLVPREDATATTTVPVAAEGVASASPCHPGSALVSVTLSLELLRDGRLTADSLTVKFCPLSLFLEDTLLYRLARMSSFVRPAWHCEPLHPPCSAGGRGGGEPQRLSPDVVVSSLALLRTVPVREMVLEPLAVQLSVHASLKLYLSLNGTPLSFARFSRKNLVTGCYQLGQLLTRHYVTGALLRAGWVVGSLDLLGNPTGLVRALGSGVSALVVLPYRGLAQGRPWAFLMGISHGASAMLRHISSGALSSVTQLATSVSRNLDRLSLDPEHLAWKESLRTGPSAGIGQGLSTLGISLLGAVAGIVDHPMQALIHEESRGPTGFVKGVGRGLMGAVAKPISGAAELVAQTGKGILQGAGWGDRSQRRHEPRSMRFDDAPSSEARVQAALPGQELLLVLEVHLLLDGDTSQPLVLVLTQQCLCLLNKADGTLERCFSLAELFCSGPATDPAYVALDLGPPHSGVHLEEMASRARVRVAEYVTRTSSYPLPPPTPECGDGPALTDQPSVAYLFRLAQPALRPLFLARFYEVQRATLGKGFHSFHHS
ncbi:vacuolar protein sorting 13B isoform X2 [Haemaphysalis longicornis]